MALFILAPHEMLLVPIQCTCIVIQLVFCVVLQCPVKYEITGDGLSTNLFNLEESTGVITLVQPFTVDVGTLYVVRIKIWLTTPTHLVLLKHSGSKVYLK